MKQREAKYIFLVNWIKDRIGTRELRPGEKLYSENELSEMFDLSRQTVRHAIGRRRGWWNGSGGAGHTSAAVTGVSGRRR